MKEQMVSYKVAKLAKEKGFKELCSHYYFNDGEFKEHEVIKDGGYYGDEYSISLEEFNEDWNNKFVTTKDGDRCFGCNNNKGYFETFSAPTQSLLQKWLREKYKMDIYIEALLEKQTKNRRYSSVLIYFQGDLRVIVRKNFSKEGDFYLVYEEALEDILEEALKII